MSIPAMHYSSGEPYCSNQFQIPFMLDLRSIEF